MRRAVWLGALLLGAAAAGLADGGRLRASAEAGDFRISLFTRPEPLTSGAADVAALVQDVHTGEAVLDAEVTFVLENPGGGRFERPASRTGRNRLFYSSSVTLTPGSWNVTARVRRGDRHAALEARLAVDRAPAAAALWPWLLLPPAGVALFAANRRLARRRGAPSAKIARL